MFLLGFVVPQFAAMYENLDAPLPWFSRPVLGQGNVVHDWWWVAAGGAGAGGGLVGPQAGPGVPREIRRMVVGTPLRWAAGGWMETARWRTMGTLLKNGVPLLTTLGIGL